MTDDLRGDSSSVGGRASYPDCASARADLTLLHDCECDEECRTRLEEHLAGCPSCREQFLSEKRIRAMLSRSCREMAPNGLRERLMVQLRRTTVTTTSTDADGHTVVNRSTVEEHRFE